MDENEIAAKIAMDAFERAIQLFVKSVDETRRSIGVKLGAGFKRYKQSAAERYGYVRTIIQRDTPIPLKSIYVPAKFSRRRKEYADSDLIELVTSPCKILILGTAGGGKSVFMRFLNLVIADSDIGIIPAFFELKALNDKPATPLMQAVFESVRTNLEDLSLELFKELVDAGRIVLILDGFDEIDYDQREARTKEISEVCKNHERASVVISSRPDDLVSSVEKLFIYEALPFSKDQTLELLTKLPYDDTAKSKFIEAVSRDLYEKHRDFLSIPLLITMMLITYHQFAEIPSKIHIFYQQAFEALFSWHDSSKDVFKRKSYSGLPIDEFQRVFSYFCARSYAQQHFTFSEVSVREQIVSAIRAETVSAGAEDVLKDLMVSTCLLQRDGLNIVFVHRSFQEYFTAIFVARLNDVQAKKAIDTVLRRTASDLVIPMAYEMNPSLVERAWVQPMTKAMKRKIAGIDPATAAPKLMSIFYDDLLFGPDSAWLSYRVGELWSMRLAVLHKLYGTGLTTIPDAEARASFKAFSEELQSSNNALKKYAKATPFDLRGAVAKKQKLGALTLRFKDLDNDILRFVDISIWARNTVALLDRVSAQVAERVGTRTDSVKSVFG